MPMPQTGSPKGPENGERPDIGAGNVFNEDMSRRLDSFRRLITAEDIDPAGRVKTLQAALADIMKLSEREGSESLTSVARLLTQYLQDREELRPKPQSIVTVHVDAMQMALTAHLKGARIPDEHDMLMGLARMAMQFP
jgi:replicative DNA helicase